MTKKPGNWRQGIAAFCRWGLAWLSIGLCTLLAGINLLRTAFMDINRESSRRELVSYEADHPLRFLLFLAAALAVTLLLQRWWSTADARRSRAMHAAIFCIGYFWRLVDLEHRRGAFGGFLFQLVWEGKSQYILQYFMLALPYGAAGLNEMAAALKTRILRLRSRQSKTAKAG